MAETQKDKQQSGPAKPFWTAGPTLHYSHANVSGFWALAVVVYVLACMLWSRIITGSFTSFDIYSIIDPARWRLDQYVVSPLSIFEYPGQIVVLGLLMGIFGVMPPLMSQLLSFSFSIPFLLALGLLADLPLFAVCVAVSCAAAACRPLRFRSRFIALSLCTAPQLFYWAYFGGLQNVEPLQWGVSFAPWICAWLTILVFSGIVLLVGHYTRYRPGLTWFVGAVTLSGAVVFFHYRVGFDELAFQQYIAKNDPEQVTEFRDQTVREALDRTIANPNSRKYFANFFYPSDPVRLRQELKDEIALQFMHDRWPSWFSVSENLNFPVKRQTLLGQYNLFINGQRPWWLPGKVHEKVRSGRQNSKRMPTVLYYKAILSEYEPDVKLFGEKEILHFNSDYPHWSCLPIWYELYEKFPESTESLEARLRIAMHLAGQGSFEKADALIVESLKGVCERMSKPAESAVPQSSGGIFTAFTQPKYGCISEIKLIALQKRLSDLHSLLKRENIPDLPAARARLAKFIMLNPHSTEYANALESMLGEMSERDGLYGNVLMARALQIREPMQRCMELKRICERYKDSDLGITAMYELSLLKVRIWQDQARPEDKRKLLQDAKYTLSKFISTYPESFFRANVQTILSSLPAE